jgi:hypothetical protein
VHVVEFAYGASGIVRTEPAMRVTVMGGMTNVSASVVVVLALAVVLAFAVVLALAAAALEDT